MKFSRRYTRAALIGRHQGRNVYRVPVIILHNDSRACATVARREFTVIAHSAADAANWARDNECENIPETEIHAMGPRGGVVTRYIGWHSAVMNELNATGAFSTLYAQARLFQRRDNLINS